MDGGEDLPMPWKETCVMDERMRFVVAALEGERPMSELCRQAGISRTTGYIWLERYREEGPAGLQDRNRAPHSHGRERPRHLVEAALSLRERYPHWGPRKLRVKLGELYPDADLPAASTIGEWLKREGLIKPRRWRRQTPPFRQPFPAVQAPNDVWCADFKGWFRTGDQCRCDPLTLSDGLSRSLLRCQAVERPDHEHVRPVFEQAFCEFGLPLAIRSDNGPPFASTGAAGLSPLAVWWLKLGIVPQRIDPGKPQQNGRHERMHRTLKAETATPPAATIAEQQARFDAFRRYFNEERPHEALGFKTPAAYYVPSPRPYPCPVREVVYPDTFAVRRVRSNGEIKWRGELIFISQVLVGEPVGLAQTDSGEWQVRFADLELGFIDRKCRRLCRRPPYPTSQACGLVDNAKTRCPQGPQAQQQAIT